MSLSLSNKPILDIHLCTIVITKYYKLLSTPNVKTSQGKDTVSVALNKPYMLLVLLVNGGLSQ